jgi:hypothetical protein
VNCATKGFAWTAQGMDFSWTFHWMDFFMNCALNGLFMNCALNGFSWTAQQIGFSWVAHWIDFHEILFESFWKICREKSNFSLKSDKNNVRVLSWTPMHIYDNISLNYS